MNGQIEKDTDRLDNLYQINDRKSRPRSSTRFVPSKLMEWMVPVLLLILAAALVGTLLLVVLSSIKP
jgi:hypothetical protein